MMDLRFESCKYPTTSPLTFITTDARSRQAREAIKVHTLRRRHRHGRQSRVPGGEFDSGGQMHIWDIFQVSSTHGSPLLSPSVDNQNQPRRENSCDEVDDSTVADVASDDSLENGHEVCVNMSFYHLDGTPERFLVYGYILRTRSAKTSREFLSCYRQSSASWSAWLATEALLCRDENMTQPAPVDTDELESFAVQEVSKKVSFSSSELEYGTMLTVALLASMKEIREERAVANWHWNALKQMISLSGGVFCLRTHEELHALLFWIDLVASNASNCALGQLSCSQGPDGVGLEIDEFFSFFDSIGYHLSSVPINSHVTSVPSRILRVLQRPSFYIGKFSINKWRRAKLACSIHISALALGSQSDRRNRSLLNAVDNEVMRREELYEVGAEELLHIILRATNEEYSCELIWFTSRIMNVIKELPSRHLNLCNNMLSIFMGGADCTFTMSSTLKNWESLSTSLTRSRIVNACNTNSMVESVNLQVQS